MSGIGGCEAPRATNLAELLRTRAKELDGKTAFAFLRSDGEEESRISYRALHDRAAVLAGELLRLVPAGARVLMLYPPGLEFIPALFGCFYAGVVAVPVAAPGRDRATDGVEAVIEACRPALVLTSSQALERMRRALAHRADLRDLPWIATDAVVGSPPAGCRALDPGAPATAADPAMLQYTSGSTSSPKGVVLGHRELLHNAGLIQRAFGTTRETRGVFWLPLYHDMGLIGGVIQPVYCGGTCTLMGPAAFLQRPGLWLETISRTRATVSGGPDFAFDLCARKVPAAERRALDLGSWEVAFTGSERIRARTLDGFCEAFAPGGFRREAFFPCYGLAEATLLVSGGPRAAGPVVFRADPEALAGGEVRAAAPDAAAAVSLVGCGEELPGQRIAIVDPATGRPAGDRRIGEIWVQGPSVARGYHERPEATAEVFGARLPEALEGPCLRTGDLGFLHGGQLFVTGRLKDLIIVRGRNYFPEDLEQSVHGVGSGLRVGHCAAFAVEVAEHDRVVLVHEVEPRAPGLDAEAAIQAIRKAIASRHELELAAVALVRAGEIPRTSSGKVRRAACRALYLEGRFQLVAAWADGPREPAPGTAGLADPCPPRRVTAAEVEAWLIERISARLRLPPGRVGRSTPFVDLGMGSLDAVETMAELEAWLGRRLSPIAVYDHPTCAALAQWLAEPPPGPAAPADPRPAPLPAADPPPGDLVRAVRAMSDAEMTDFLQQELAKDRGG